MAFLIHLYLIPSQLWSWTRLAPGSYHPRTSILCPSLPACFRWDSHRHTQPLSPTATAPRDGICCAAPDEASPGEISSVRAWQLGIEHLAAADRGMPEAATWTFLGQAQPGRDGTIRYGTGGDHETAAAGDRPAQAGLDSGLHFSS
ncbi:uncharacterized protein BO80DRAFT_217032 [Aspergillus ibericus CBS 121593]|uniref:Uncharacterized protein n=1 Tax=Aspergillus ibericus CBS 121593 TaxID=1448316 RepID=A0A395GNZ2_9EURO|nr:hypothetical protein BO80DRAFT_217032 [Aspergillus ibericus CBS 121593]RAK96678.1 hypothetical protein BO80DRAFT_217032 [Aspergillus ibericus CBS 121593]